MTNKILSVILITATLLFITGCGEDKERVLIYSSQDTYRDEELQKRLNEEFPEYEVVIQYFPTGNNAAKIQNEGSDIEGDIILALDTGYMENLKDNFANLDNFDDSHYLEGINPSHDKFFIVEKYTSSIIIDADYFEEKNWSYPKTYEDLLNKKYEGLIAMPDPKTSGTGYSFVLNVINEMGEKDGLEYFDKLENNIYQFTSSGSGPVNLLNQKEIAIAFGLTYHGAKEINDGQNYKIIELETGTPYSQSGMAIIDGREDSDAVKEVFNYISEEWNKYLVENMVPCTLFKEQEIKMENFPNDLIDANMKDIQSIERKEEILEMWKY